MELAIFGAIVAFFAFPNGVMLVVWTAAWTVLLLYLIQRKMQKSPEWVIRKLARLAVEFNKAEERLSVYEDKAREIATLIGFKVKSQPSTPAPSVEEPKL